MHPEFTDNQAFIFSICYCIFMLALGLIFLKFPPKKINSLYGYRTQRSMLNPVIWDAANKFWTKTFVKLNVTSFVVPVIAYLVYPSQNILITIIANTLLLLVTIPLTEKYLNNRFDKEGNLI